MTARLMARIAFNGYKPVLDIDGLAVELQQAGYEVHRIPEKYRKRLDISLDDHLEVVIAGHDENEVWKEIDGIAERHGGLCDEYPVAIEPEYEPFAEFFKGVKAMHRHVHDLCNKHGITIYAWCRRPSQCHALIDRDEIRIVQIESRISYAAALHEIGHLRGRYQCSSSTLTRERWAWEWARANALIWTPVMENSAREAVKWYARHAKWHAARRNGTAHHEAGHAVIGRVLGLLGGSATIAANYMLQAYGGADFDSAEETVEYWHRPISKGGNKKLVLRSLACARRARVIMSMAGREAELECLGTSRGNDGDRVDSDDIDELMPRIYPEASRTELLHRRDRLHRITRTLVRRHCDKIERVACALLRRRTLSWRAIYDLLPEIPAPAPHRVELGALERKHAVPPPPDCVCELCVDRRRVLRRQAQSRTLAD